MRLKWQIMMEKYDKDEGIKTVTTESGFKFDYYYSIVNEDAFDRYSNFIYLVIKRINESNKTIRRAYLVPFTLLDEFFKSVNLPGERLVHVEPITMDMVATIKQDLRQDHTPVED
jgi:hypothetical protein